MDSGPPSTGRDSSPRVVRIISRLNVGGPTRQAIALARDLPAEGFETLLVAGISDAAEGDWTDRARDAGIRLEIVPELRRRPGPLRDAVALRRVRSILRRERPSIVHTHLAKAGAIGRIAAASLGVPVRIHTFHGHAFRGHFGAIGSRAALLAERALAPLTTQFLAVAEAVHDDLVALGVARAERIAVLRPGLDLAPYLAADAGAGSFRAAHDVPREAPLLVAVGRLAPVKGIGTLLRALASLEGALLALVGDGPSRGALEALAAALGVASRVRFVGFLEDPAPALADADVVVLSSRSEGLPLALVEAMAAARPVVAAAVGGVPELVVHDRTGLLVPPDDPASLAAAVAELLSDPRRRAEMGARGRARVRERYALRRFVGDHAALYRALLAREARAQKRA